MKKARDFIIKLASTFFFLGFFPYIPGTFASFVCLFFVWFLKDLFFIYFLATLLIIVLGFLLSGKAELIFNRKDAPCIVIDEAGGIFLSFLFVPLNFKSILLGFFLFRVLDTLKIFPASRLEKLRGAGGVMLDDLVAGIYTNIILQFVFRLWL
jgi:phosphatidylglycerophosphatase A